MLEKALSITRVLGHGNFTFVVFVVVVCKLLGDENGHTPPKLKDTFICIHEALRLPIMGLCTTRHWHNFTFSGSERFAVHYCLCFRGPTNQHIHLPPLCLRSSRAFINLFTLSHQPRTNGNYYDQSKGIRISKERWEECVVVKERRKNS